MIKIDTYSGKYLEKEGYAGIRIGDEVIEDKRGRTFSVIFLLTN